MRAGARRRERCVQGIASRGWLRASTTSTIGSYLTLTTLGLALAARIAHAAQLPQWAGAGGAALVFIGFAALSFIE